jgi:hypothetical protein
MSEKRSRIVDAMEELKDRREAGELAHVILEEVAIGHRVPVEALRLKAERSWGAPLETDRERHATHFEFQESKADIRNRARVVARKVWDANAPIYDEFEFLTPNWPQEFEKIIKRSDVDHPELVDIARREFLAEMSRLDKLKRAGCISTTPNPQG